MVAASKMRKAQQAAIEAAPFARCLYRMQRAATATPCSSSTRCSRCGQVRKRAVILVGADKGLCGALNTNVFRLASQFDTQTTVFITAGRKAAQFVARTGRHAGRRIRVSRRADIRRARAIAALRARPLHAAGEVDQVRIVTTRFVNTLTQEPVSLEYLPVGEIRGLKVPGVEPEDESVGETGEDVRAEPGSGPELSRSATISISIIYFVLLNAKASEQSARMVSMKNATDSAETLIKDLSSNTTSCVRATSQRNCWRSPAARREYSAACRGQQDAA